MSKLPTAAELFHFLEDELKARNIDKLCVLDMDEVEDEELEQEIDYMSWRYEPEAEGALDATIYYDDGGLVSIHIGPVDLHIDVSEINVKKAVLTTILMVLNGQLKLVVTYPKIGGLGRFQAAELYLTGYEQQPTVLQILSNHTRGSRKLLATTLENHIRLDRQPVTQSFWLLPDKINGHYPKGREVDFDAPTPLTRSAYKLVDESLTIQGLGGEAEEPFWSYFYRTTEFWLVTTPILALDIWLISTFFNDDSWTSIIAKYSIHLVTPVLSVFLTSILLARRQAQLDADHISPFERGEDTITVLGVSKLLAVASVFTLLFAPMWTPAGDFTNLYPGTKYALMYPLIPLGCLLLLAPLVFNKAAGKVNKLIKSLLYSAGIGLIFLVNGLYMNTADNSPQIATQWVILGLVLPFAINIWMYYKTFGRANPRDKKGWL